MNSIVNYSKINDSVEPLQKELKGLEEKTNVVRARQAELQKIMVELQQRIEQFKVGP